jgi:hypothetical protein
MPEGSAIRKLEAGFEGRNLRSGGLFWGIGVSRRFFL